MLSFYAFPDGWQAGNFISPRRQGCSKAPLLRERANPAALKPEVRGAKSERNPKSEAPKSDLPAEASAQAGIRSPHAVPHSVRSLRDAEAPVASVLSAEPMPESFAISAFGFRPSNFLRISAFGFRIFFRA